MKEIKRFNVNTDISEYQLVNPNFAKVLVKIAYADENRNKTNISKESFNKASGTLPYIPIVGHFLKDQEIFGGHDEEIVITDNDFKINSLTIPYGVVSNEQPFWKSFKELDGSFRDYYCCFGYLWIGRYPELEGIKTGDYKQSMEILVNSGTYSENGYFIINDFTFDALCILQRDEPCFEGSKITTDFSTNNFEKDYKEMIDMFKNYTLETFNEGGKKMDEENKELEILKEKEMISEEVIENESAINNEQEIVEEVIVEKDSDNSDEEKLDYQVIISDLENKLNIKSEEYKVLEGELNKVKADYTTLNSNFATLQSDKISLDEEIVGLRQFKADKEIEFKESQVDEVLAKFTELQTIEGYDELVKEKFNYTLEELETKLKVFAFDNNIVIGKKQKFSTKTEKPVNLPLENKIDNGGYTGAWNVLDKYNK